MFEVLSSVLFHLSTFVVTFYSLCILCDEHLVPAVEVFIKQFEVPEEVAAVTLVAFGSAAPELFLNSVSAFTHTSDLSLSAILGSGMIAFGFIPPLCLIFTHHNELAVRVYPLLRECGFYLIGLLIFVIALNDGKIETNEALILLFVYLCYVSMVIVIYWQEKQHREIRQMLQELPAIQNMLNSKSNSNSQTDLENIAIPPSPSPSSLKLEEFQALLQQHSPIKASRSSSPSTPSLRILSSPSLPPSQLLTVSKKYSEDVDDARSTENLRYNHYYERFIQQIHTIISTPVREILKVFVPTLLPEDPDVPYNLFNIVASYMPYISNLLSTLIAIILATPPSPRHRGNQSVDHHIISRTIDGGSRINRTGDEESESLLKTPSARLSKSGSGSPLGSEGGNEDDHHLRVPLNRVFLVVGVCILCISIAASVIVFASESLIRSLGLDISTMGVTLVAFGSEIPDTISAIALARGGYHDGALAGAIGSQVINISLGVGIPSLFICLTGRGYLKLATHEADNLWFLACLLFVVISSFLMLTVPFNRIMNLPTYSSLTKSSAMIQISVCILIYLIFLSFN